MTQGCDPLSPDEFLLRRIPFDYVDPDAPDDQKIRMGHFEPHPGRDDDGISVFREKFVSPQELVDNASGKGPYFVAKTTVGELRQIGLTPTITDSQDHVSIPELSVAAVQANDNESRKLMDEIAKLLGKNIVLGPVKPRRNAG